jgi:GNAT superfamily N-acetyltransferase
MAHMSQEKGAEEIRPLLREVPLMESDDSSDGSAIEVRRARRSDLRFIHDLLVESLVESIPDRRDIPSQAIRERARTQIKLEDMLGRRREFAFLVALDGETPAGFLILELNQVEETTGESQTLIYHLAVAPSYLGKRVDRLLVCEAAKVTHNRGSRYMIGRISASNRRAVLTALRQGFELERHQVVMACGPEGAVPMPGRSAEERQHDVRRLAQKQKRRTPKP